MSTKISKIFVRQRQKKKMPPLNPFALCEMHSKYERTILRTIPQEVALSPLLSNTLLDALDKELARRGHSFCRYADDCNIYVRTQRSGERVRDSITRYIEKVLKLKMNPLS